MGNVTTYEQVVYIRDSRDGYERPQTVRVQASNTYQARQLMEAYGRVSGVPYPVR